MRRPRLRSSREGEAEAAVEATAESPALHQPKAVSRRHSSSPAVRQYSRPAALPASTHLSVELRVSCQLADLQCPQLSFLRLHGSRARRHHHLWCAGGAHVLANEEAGAGVAQQLECTAAALRRSVGAHPLLDRRHCMQYCMHPPPLHPAPTLRRCASARSASA